MRSIHIWGSKNHLCEVRNIISLEVQKDNLKDVRKNSLLGQKNHLNEVRKIISQSFLRSEKWSTWGSRSENEHLEVRAIIYLGSKILYPCSSIKSPPWCPDVPKKNLLELRKIIYCRYIVWKKFLFQNRRWKICLKSFLSV